MFALFGLVLFTANSMRNHSRSQQRTKAERADDFFIPNTIKYVHPAPAQIM
jgi:hypothetical protein